MRKAYYADFIYYDGAIRKNSWLLTKGSLVEGLTDNKDNINGYEEIVFKNSAIFPGLINTHTHLGMSVFRGMADDLPLMTWLNDYIWPAEKRRLSAEFVYDATMLSIAEQIHSGVTCSLDMYFYFDSIARAFRDAKVRGVVGFGIIGNFEKAFRQVEAFEETDLIKASIAPHALYTVSTEVFKLCAEFSRKHDVLLHSHLSETKDEVEQIMCKFGGRSPVEVMNETGAFDVRSVFAHCVHLNDNDIKILGDKNVSISHCLESNLKLASGFSPISKLIEAGANITIGTDGAASNNDQSMVNEMSTVAKVHKALDMDAASLPAASVLKMATENAAKAIGNDKIGVLKQGNFADFFVLSFDSSNVTPVYHPISHLIYAAQSHDITDLFVNGKQIMADRKITTFDEEEFKNKARKHALSLIM